MRAMVIAAILRVGSPTNAATRVLAGAHYFGGWSDDCPAGSKPGCYSHFHGFTPTGQPTANWFPSNPERTPLLGMYTTDKATVAREVAAADKALDFFDILYYDGGADCGPNTDPGLRWCLDSSLAFMLNSTTIWQNTSRLHFFISYSNDIDRNRPNCFVGSAGDQKWAGLVKTWSAAMAHPRYLKINNRPVFKVLIPEIFISECGGNATLATLRLAELRDAAKALGLAEPLIGGGWDNPSVPYTGQGIATPRPHPSGFMEYKDTKVACPGGCTIRTAAVTSVRECQGLCNTTTGCEATVIDHSNKSCALLNSSSPGAPDATHDTWVRVPATVEWEWTGTYNAAPPVCLQEKNWQCSK